MSVSSRPSAFQDANLRKKEEKIKYVQYVLFKDMILQSL